MGQVPDDERIAAPVSVVLSTLTRPPTLQRTLQALAAGTVRPAEVVVVDQSGRPLQPGELECGLTVVHVAMTQKGLSASQNLGVASASYGVVAITDDDCVPDPCWIETAGRVVRGEVDLLTGRVLPLPAVGDRTLALSTRNRTERLVLTRGVLPWDMGTGGNFVVRRELYVRVGGNDERLGSGTPARAGNDLDLFWRLLRAQAHGEFDPHLLVLHERATPEQRRDRRWGYGAGVGAAVVGWLRQRDRRGLVVLVAWLRMRLRLLLRAAVRGRVTTVGEELRVLRGTLAGVLIALRGTGEPPPLAGLRTADGLRLAHHVAVLSPHCDDAVLSLGATLAAHVRSGGRVTVVTVLAGDPTGTDPAQEWDVAFATSGEAARVRQAEDRAACARLGVELVLIPEQDGQYPRSLSDEELWARVVHAVDGADEVLVPGHPLRHLDHRRVAEGALAVLPAHLPVRLYVEQPYADWLRVKPLAVAAVRADPLRSAVLWRRARLSGRDVRAKLRATASYRSQLPLLAAPTRWPLVGARGRLFLWHVLRATRAGEHVSDPLPRA